MSKEHGERLEPFLDRVLLERRVMTKTKGGVILTDTAAKRDASHRCTVLAVGPSCESSLRPGDEVVISAHGGTWISVTGHGAAKPDVETFIISEVDILAVVRKDEAGAAALAATSNS